MKTTSQISLHKENFCKYVSETDSNFSRWLSICPLFHFAQELPMASKAGEISEEEVALLTVEIAVEQSNGIASYDLLRMGIPKRYKLSAADLAPSVTRPHESMWEQKIRNIKS